MRRIYQRCFVLSIICIVSSSAVAQIDNPSYNKILADSLGADDYGMKKYVLVLLKTGATSIEHKTTRDSLFTGHLQNMGRLAKRGSLIVAGPLAKNEKDYRGIFILNVKTIDEAKVLLQSDPAIQAGLLASELYSWYGSAALPLYLPHHEHLEKKKMQ